MIMTTMTGSMYAMKTVIIVVSSSTSMIARTKKIVEIIKVKIVHFKRKDGYHKYHIYDDSWASCNDNHDGYWVETPKYDYEVVRYPKDNHCVKPFSHKESYNHKVWKGGEERGTIIVKLEFIVNASGHHKVDYSFDFKSKWVVAQRSVISNGDCSGAGTT